MKKAIVVILLGLSLILATACGSGITQEQFNAVESEKAVLESELQAANDKIATAESAQKEAENTLSSTNKELEKLKKEYADYKESMKPFEEMTAAQAEAEKAKAEQEAAKIAEEEAAKKKAEEEAAAQKAAEEKAAKEAEEAKGYETGITFDQLARTPDDYEGKKVKFYGRVVQVIEGDDSVQIRFAVDDDYDKVIFGEYDSSIVSSRVLEDDKITIYGVSANLISYESTMGGTITIPAVYIEKIDF